ncbi:hypothetical protein [Nonomuraea fuscirosea]|uniref:hypothetical protein n=1 Tax=Nonomuraea fuscirosea TaxID=1291556 RepID=UPI000D05D005|nr:hypothetical protein [Nonomuraea fuscirosea]
MSTGDELRAAVSARRDLGPEFEDAVVESFLDRVGTEIDRRVDERVAQIAPEQTAKVARPGPTEAQRLALAIVSMALGTIMTLVLVFAERAYGLIWIWLGIIVVNSLYNSNKKS